ncbi:2OG-Fe(II) oxygenase [Alteromonas sp. ASW11-130]|uniref:2OG-Fe(II) oxygenase n=1 Tax=Alteromonas sp. ASW11-130 TaxID=3015775 RepID=UPI002241DAA1|nr:2OG-Fe(II) oxygenase [Alteromonas sp. ASW11-130]MCW8091954.1 2OG-Fe(II) oxygenase [Alteromonas sp. ASW11-130]
MNNLADFIKVYDNAIDPAVCKILVEKFERNSAKQILNGKAVREHLPNSQWTELDIGRFLDKNETDYMIKTMFKYTNQYNVDCNLQPALPEPGSIDQLILKRYNPNGEDKFELHFDSLGNVASRYLVVLWYLNDVEEGGETCFPRLDIKVQPKAGRLLIFPPYWLYMHHGNPPISCSKYIASTYYHW